APPNYSVQINNSAGGFGADPNIVENTSLHSLTAPLLNQEVYAPFYSTPEAAVAMACSLPSHEVYFPAGLYTITTGMLACSGLHLRCAASYPGATNGALFQAAPGAAVWMLKNPGSDLQVTVGAGNIQGTEVDDCAWDMSIDPQALGAWQIKGWSNSNWRGNFFYSNANPNPVITRDGGNYAWNYGDYDNTFIGNGLFD